MSIIVLSPLHCILYCLFEDSSVDKERLVLVTEWCGQGAASAGLHLLPVRLVAPGHGSQ